MITDRKTALLADRALEGIPDDEVDKHGVPLLEVEHVTDNRTVGAPYTEVRIDFEILKGIVAEYLRQKCIEELESAPYDDLLEGLV